MSIETPSTPKKEKQIGYIFRIEPDKENGRVKIYDGAAKFVFTLVDGNPVCVIKPLQYIDPDKYAVIVKRAAAILRDMEKEEEK